jgi:secreted PhoX family phosphatase
MTLKDGNAEFTGIEFLEDGRSFLIHLQHRSQSGRRVAHTTDELVITGLRVPD